MHRKNSQPQYDETSLIQALKQGDGRAYEQAIKRYTPGMMASARFYFDPTTAEDMVQESWIKVTKSVATFEGRSGLSTWLHRIVVNTAKNHLRKTVREALFDDQNQFDTGLAARFDHREAWLTPPAIIFEDNGESLAENDDLTKCLNKHIGSLSEQQRSAVILYELHEHNSGEVCQILGISASNLRVSIHRARQKVYVMLEHWHETGDC